MGTPCKETKKWVVPSECDMCGYDLSKLTEVLEVKMAGNFPDSRKNYRYCSDECSEEHQDIRCRQAGEPNDD